MRSRICVFVLSASLAWGAQQSFTPAAPVSLHSWSVNGGLWRTDAGFSSMIQLKNRLVTAPITVTPELFMADGTEYDLPAVDLPASGLTTIDVKTVLARAPQGVLSHLSCHGSVTLRFNGSATALIAQMAIGSTSLSESFVSPFISVVPGSAAMQTLEGLWWARDAGIGGFIGVSNAAAESRAVTIRAVSANGQTLAAQLFVLAPHASKMVDLLTLIGRQPSAGEAGGVRIQFKGLLGEVNVSGGLENRQEGYSAVIPFWQAPMGERDGSPEKASIAHPGIMVGPADPAMGFPVGTRFTPYLALRNLTGSAQQVNLTLYTTQGTALAAPSVFLQSFESRQIEMASVIEELGLQDFHGELTLKVDHSGGASDVMSVAGSVDAKGTYVFEVNGRAVEQKLSKQSPYWSVKNGNDTMVALWNPEASAQDVMVTLKYAGGSGIYHHRVHLAPHATANIDLKELIANQSRDEEGNMLPMNAGEGSLVIHNAKDVHAPLSVNVNVGIFNVVKGTCYYGYVQCDGYSGNLIVSPSSFSLAADGGQQWLSVYGQYSDGSQPGVNASLSSSNSSVASVSSPYVTAGNTAGQATITATANLPVSGEYYGYDPSCSLQSYNNFTGTATASVGDMQPVITGISPSDWNAGTTTSVTFLGQSFGTDAPKLTFSPAAGISYVLTAYNDTIIVANVTVAASTPNETVTVVATAGGYNGQGFQSNGNGQSSQSAPANAAVHRPTNNTEITVIGWVNGNSITLPTGENSGLYYDLGSPLSCALDVYRSKRTDLITSADVAYANAFLLKNSNNPPPPATITPSQYATQKSNFRIFNIYGSPAGGAHVIGTTPDPCGTGIIPDWYRAGQPSPYDGATGTSPSGQTYQLAEGQIGSKGQAVNQTLNGKSTPYIWTVIEFNSAGTPTYTDHAIFPSYSFYQNGAFLYTYPQSDLSTFIAKDASYQRTPSQIP